VTLCGYLITCFLFPSTSLIGLWVFCSYHVLQAGILSLSSSPYHHVIIIIISSIPRTKSWSLSQVSSALSDSRLLPTRSLFRASLHASSPHLARGLHAYLSPSGCIFSSPLGVQNSSNRVTGPAHRSLAILITTEISSQTAAGNFIFATAMSRPDLRHVLPPVLLAQITSY
jgi:hypothetical protein